MIYYNTSLRQRLSHFKMLVIAGYLEQCSQTHNIAFI